MTVEQRPVHFAGAPKNFAARMPMCGYCPDEDGITRDPAQCTCLECLDWIRPNHDAIKLRNPPDQTDGQPFPGEHGGEGKL